MKKKWHILHVFPSFDTGGCSVRSSQIINEFGDDYYHSILAMDQCYGGKAHIKKQNNVEYIYSDSFIKPISLFKKFFLLRQWLKKIQPDLMITSNWGSSDWFIANSIFPLCPYFHMEDGFNEDEMVRQKFRRVLIRRIFLHNVKVMVPAHTLEKIALEIWKIPRKNVLYIANGIEWSRFYLPDLSQKPDTCIIGTVCGLRKVKNIPRLMNAFSSLPEKKDAKLWIVGIGSEKEKLESLARESFSSCKIEFLGHKEDPSDCYKQMRIFAISSDTEQMPISVLEAMAAGCAIISTDVGDIKNMVSEENKKFIIPKENEAEYREKLNELMQNRELCEKLGKSNQEKCYQEYTKENMMDNYTKLYQSFFNKNRL